MQYDVSPLFDKMTFIEPGAEHEIISCLISNCARQRNVFAGVDYTIIDNHAKKRGFATHKTIEALQNLSRKYCMTVTWEKIEAYGTPQTFETYYLDEKVGSVVQEYVENWNLIKVLYQNLRRIFSFDLT